MNKNGYTPLNRKDSFTSQSSQSLRSSRYSSFSLGENLNQTGKAGIYGSIFNLTNTIIGGGVLSLPYAFYLSGLALGLFFMIVVYLLSVLSMFFLLECSIVLGIEGITYHMVAEKAYGFTGIVATDISVIVSCFGVMCSYLVIIFDMLSPLIGEVKREIVICISAAILIPLSSLKKLNIYKFVSFMAILSILYLVFMIVIKSIKGLAEGSWQSNCEENGCATIANFGVSFFRTIPIFSFAFTCQMNFYSIYNELEYQTPQKMKYVIWGSLSICVILYSLVGLFGYLDFYDEVKGNILLNYDPDDPFAGIARVAMTIVITFSYPMMAHPCVNGIQELFLSGKDIKMFQRVILVAVITILAALIAIFVEDVSLIFGLTGATASSALCFILPGLFYLSIHPTRYTQPAKIAAIFLSVCGFIFLFASTIVTILDMTDGSDRFNVTSLIETNI